MQIVGPSAHRPGVKIRYKLVQNGGMASTPAALPAVDTNSAKGLRLECRPIAAKFATDQRVGINCRVINTTSETKAVRWSINGGNNFCLTPSSQPVGSGGLMPQPLPSLDKAYLIKDDYPPFTQKILYLPPGETVEIHLDCGYFERPQTFSGRIVYDPLSPRNWVSTDSNWTNELAVSDVFTFEVVAKKTSGPKPTFSSFSPVVERTNDAALLAEPPKLRYLEWDEAWKTNHPGGVHYPDGSLVANKQELAWLEYVSPGMMSDVSGQPKLAKQHPHFLHLWFSHPLFDDSFFAEVTLTDEYGKNPTDFFSQRVGEIKAAEPQNGNFDWLVESLMCGAGTNIPAKVTIRLRYTVGPLEQIQEIPSDYSGYLGIFGDSQLGSIGQDARGNTLVTIGVNPQTMKTRQYCVVAVTKDGRKLMSGGGISGNSDGSGPQLSRFGFAVPLSEVAKFTIGTRPIRTNEWKDVVLPKN